MSVLAVTLQEGKEQVENKQDCKIKQIKNISWSDKYKQIKLVLPKIGEFFCLTLKIVLYFN